MKRTCPANVCILTIITAKDIIKTKMQQYNYKKKGSVTNAIISTREAI